MRSLMVNKALAGQTWQAPTSLINYPVDEHGLVSIFDDSPGDETKDKTEAKAAGFVDYDPGPRVLMQNVEYGARKVPGKDGHRVKMTTVAARDFVCTGTDHHYHADDDGKIDVFEIDVEEAKAAGFVPV